MLSSRPIVGNAIETDVVFDVCHTSSDLSRTITSGRHTFTIIASEHVRINATDLSMLGAFPLRLLMASCWSRIGSIGGSIPGIIIGIMMWNDIGTGGE
jgi:hypothetical protein